MSGLSFSREAMLWALWIAVPLLWFVVASFRRKDELLERFAAIEALARLLPDVSRRRQHAKAAMQVLAMLLAVIALAGPTLGHHWEEVQRRGVDIVVALDLSQSMLAEDVSPNRLERAKREIYDLLDMLQGDRIGLVVFAGSAFIQCPLTLDYGALHLFLESVGTNDPPIQGTNLADAIETAERAFPDDEATSRAMILITDGEDHEGAAVEAAQAAAEQGMRIFAIGIGSDGAPIPQEGGGFKQDERGNMVVSRLDEEALKRVALETGGAYVRSTTGDLDLEEIYLRDIKGTMESRELASTRRRIGEERYQWILALVLLLLGMEPLVSERTPGRRRRLGRGASAVVLAVGSGMALSLFPAVSEASRFASPRLSEGYEALQAERYDDAVAAFLDAQLDMPGDQRVEYNLGHAYYRLGDHERAEEAFAHVAATAPDAVLRQQAAYNLGNTLFQQGRLEEAISTYEAAVELDADDADAQHNLDVARAELRRRLNEAQEQQEQQQQQQQQQPQQQQGEDEMDGLDDEEEQQQGSPQDGEQPPEEQQQEQSDPSEEQPPPEADGEQPPPSEQERAGTTEQEEQSTEEEQELDEMEAPAGIEETVDEDSEPLDPDQLTPEEAERLLQNLQEDRRRLQRQRTRRRAGGNDW